MKDLLIDYTNWRGERSTRRIRPTHVWFGSTEWHPEPCWLLAALDVGKRAERDFAMASIHSITEIE